MERGRRDANGAEAAVLCGDRSLLAREGCARTCGILESPAPSKLARLGCCLCALQFLLSSKQRGGREDLRRAAREGASFAMACCRGVAKRQDGRAAEKLT